MRATLEAAGFTSVDPSDPGRVPMQPTPPGRLLVSDRSGALRTATTSRIAQGTWHHLRLALQRLVEEPHQHVVRLHDAFPLLDEHGSADVAESDEPREVVLVWHLADPGRTLGAFAQDFELDAWQVSAALVGCARGLVFLSACGLGLPEDWRLGNALLGGAGHIQILPAPIRPSEQGASSEDLARIAESGLHLLRWLEGVPPPLRDLLNRTVRNRGEVTAGTFAANCHDLLEPVAPEGWAPRPLTSEPEGATSDVLRTWRAHVLRADPDSEPSDVRRSRSSQQKIGKKAVSVSRRNFPERKTRRGRDGAAGRRTVVIGAVASLALLGGAVWGPRHTPARINSHPIDSGQAIPEPGQSAPAPSQPADTDPRDAALELTAERVSILASLSETDASSEAGDGLGDEGSDDAGLDDAGLGRVLVGDSDLMRRDRELVSRLRTQPPMNAVRVEPGRARTLTRSPTEAVVEVTYDLVSDDGTRLAQEAILGLALTPEGWRVSRVSSATARTDHGTNTGAQSGSGATDPTRR